MMVPMTPVGVVSSILLGLSTVLGFVLIVGYVMWRSWQSAHHTNQVHGRQRLSPVTDVTKTRETVDGEEIHP